MLISELISELQNLKEKHGDGYVYWCAYWKNKNMLNEYGFIHRVAYEEVQGGNTAFILTNTMSKP